MSGYAWIVRKSTNGSFSAMSSNNARASRNRRLAWADGSAHIVPHPAELIRPPLERAVEDLPGHRDEIRMGDPRAVETIVRFARLVFPDLRERDLVRRRIFAARDERGHAANRMRPAAVACLHEELRGGPHERDGHRELRSIRQYEIRPPSQPLADAEAILPSPGSEARRVVA